MSNYPEFNELEFFAKAKKRPGIFFGRKSLISLRDFLFGMSYSFTVSGHSDALNLFDSFIAHYNNELFLTNQDSYVCW